MKTIFTVCTIVLIGAIMVVMPAAAAFEPGECDIYVHSGESIDNAVDSASDGQTVCVYNGSYSGVVSVNTKNITIKGEGADVVTYQDDTFYIVFGDTGAPSGCIIEGFKIVNNKGIQVMSPAPDCIIRNCVFEGLTSIGIQLAGSNTTFENNSVVLKTGGYYTIWISGDYCTIANNIISTNKPDYYGIYLDSWTGPGNNALIANNIITNNTGTGVMLYNPVVGNNTIIRNNISMNDKGIWLYDTSDNKIYLNNIIGNSVEYGGTVSSISWNSTEQIEYVYGGTSYTNYLGNYWSDYGGTDADGDGIGDTDYDTLPADDPDDPVHHDTRPLMAGFENYLGEAAGPTPTSEVYFEPANVSASFCEERTVSVWANTSAATTGGKIVLNYTCCCANVTDWVRNTTNFATGAADIYCGYASLTFASTEVRGPGLVHIGDLTIHCCNDTSDCETDLVFVTDECELIEGPPDFANIEPVEWLDGTINCTAPAAQPDLNVTEKYETFDDGTFTVTYTVKNVGGAGAGASNTTIYVDGTAVGEDPVPALTAGANYTNTVGSFDCPCGATVNVTVCADNENVVSESDETNNCEVNIVKCQPDLEITDIWTEVKVGKKANKTIIYYNITNNGGVEAGKSVSNLTVDGVEQKKKDKVKPLAAGETRTESFKYRGKTAPGTIMVCADCKDKIVESNETNNCCTWP